MFENIKDKLKSMKEKKEFLNAVNENTKPIRRQAYLETKRKQALEEGKIIAQKELEKQKQDLEREKQRTKNMNLNQSQFSIPEWNTNKSRRKK